MEYDFEKCLKENKLDISIIQARRFAVAVQRAIEEIDHAAGCYRLFKKPYYLETKTFLEEKLTRLEAPMQNNEDDAREQRNKKDSQYKRYG